MGITIIKNKNITKSIISKINDIIQTFYNLIVYIYSDYDWRIR